MALMSKRKNMLLLVYFKVSLKLADQYSRYKTRKGSIETSVSFTPRVKKDM